MFNYCKKNSYFSSSLFQCGSLNIHTFPKKSKTNIYINLIFFFFILVLPSKTILQINNILHFFGNIGIDYFQVLVQVFQQVMLSKEHPYLKNFYMIIPALCINYVDTIRVSKDKMDKVKRQGARQTAYFTDDGFAIGIA